ncbi:GNAT family N-acetyltransferase [Candidatus Uhrbacteria bacterium]|nr:GNAT family N-acetyltransferase [Candidatus Uhrbacteria bacterium]
MITYSRLINPTIKDHAQLVRLIRQLSSAPRELTLTDLHTTALTHELVVARDDELEGDIVGTALLVAMFSISHVSGHIEDVVVDRMYRGRGIGRELTLQLIAHAREIGIERIDLCSEPEREAANRLYRSLGFAVRDTNLYRLKL